LYRIFGTERHVTDPLALLATALEGRGEVIGENLDDVIGVAYLKDVTKRVFDRHEAEMLSPDAQQRHGLWDRHVNLARRVDRARAGDDFAGSNGHYHRVDSGYSGGAANTAIN